MKSLRIDKPCSENWNEFTPTQQGAFCQSCQIDVIDFSEMSPDQVKQTLEANAGAHMCGRFKKDQLDYLNDQYFNWENQSSKTFQSKFVYALMLVFGMTLFTGCNVDEANFFNQISTSQSNWFSNNLLESESVDTPEVKQNNIFNDHRHIKGKIAYNPDWDNEEQIAEPVIPEDTTEEEVIEKIYLMGEIAIEPVQEIDSVHVAPVTPDSNAVSQPIWHDTMVDGGFMVDPDYIEYLEDTLADPEPTPEVDNSEQNVPIEINSTEAAGFSAKLYPNPTSDLAKVEIEVENAGYFEVYLFATDGKRIQYVYQGNISKGRKIFNIDLTSYPRGVYFIMINSGEHSETLKIQKV